MTQAHAERAHALLGASKASQWINCPPSARLQESVPDSKSVYAAEGEFMHELAECILRTRLIDPTKVDWARLEAMIVSNKESPYFNSETEQAVLDYVAVVEEQYLGAKQRSEDAVLMLEEQLDFSEWVPDGFGTGDVVIISDGVLDIIDLKGGKGVPVSAVENPQMKLYALGALTAYNYLYGIEEVRMTIVQPRLDNVSTYTMSTKELLDWAETVVRPAAALAFAGEGDFNPGDHCRFCKVKATCRARADENLKALQYEFREPALIADEDIGPILEVAQRLKVWANDVEVYAFERAKAGHKIPLWKLVSGKSNRSITDKNAARIALESAGYKHEQFLKPVELLGITDLEKRIGKKELTTLIGGFIVKPPGKPVLVPETDPRDELNSVESVFENESFN